MSSHPPPKPPPNHTSLANTFFLFLGTIAEKFVAASKRQMLPGPTPEEKFLARSQDRILRLRAKRYGLIAGRHAYYADMLLKAKHMARSQGKSVAAARLKVMQLHS